MKYTDFFDEKSIPKCYGEKTLQVRHTNQ